LGFTPAGWPIMGELALFHAFKAHRMWCGVEIHYRPTLDRRGAEFVVTLYPDVMRRVFAASLPTLTPANGARTNSCGYGVRILPDVGDNTAPFFLWLRKFQTGIF